VHDLDGVSLGEERAALGKVRHRLEDYAAGEPRLTKTVYRKTGRSQKEKRKKKAPGGA
jgi:hypothetical protein